jgi:cyclic-di-GMP-binding protein
MLKLTVPGLGSPPSDAVETRPKWVHAWLERLPFAHPTEAARQLTARLAEMNRTPLNEAERYRCLALMHPVIMRLAAGLEPLLAESGLPPSRNSRHAGELLRELWLELGYGYKRVLLSLIGKRSGLGGGQRFVDVTTRLLLVMRNHQFACYQTYTPPPRGLWREMHHLHLFAYDAGFADKPAAENGVSASLVYRQALLMALADPHHLEPEALLLTRRYLKKHGALAQLSKRHDPVREQVFPHPQRCRLSLQPGHRRHPTARIRAAHRPALPASARSRARAQDRRHSAHAGPARGHQRRVRPEPAAAPAEKLEQQTAACLPASPRG